MQEFSFTHDGHKLDAGIFYPSQKEEKYPAILFVHGWTAERTRSYQYAEALANLGYICFLFDMRGHGSSEGDRNASSSKDFLSDVVAAYDHLTGIKEVDTENISVVGSSFGCYLISLLTKKRVVKNLVLRAPANYPDDVFEVERGSPNREDFNMMAWRNEKKTAADTYALEAIHSFTGKILLIESELDDQIPHQTIMNYVNAAKDGTKLTHVVMEGAPHSIKQGKFRDQVTQILVDWFRQL